MGGFLQLQKQHLLSDPVPSTQVLPSPEGSTLLRRRVSNQALAAAWANVPEDPFLGHW